MHELASQALLRLAELWAGTLWPAGSVAEVLRRYGPGYLRRFPERVSPRQAYVLAQLLQCRQLELGSHAWHCPWCGVSQVAYNGCRNRHCASCGRTRRHDWLRMIRGWTLPVSYLHIIFTLPHELTPLILANDRLLYNLQFEACRRTLIALAERTWGATPGLTMVLHTWGQEALYHPHTHILQTAGGLSPDRRAWIAIDPEDAAYEGKQLAHGFRARYLQQLVALYRQGKLTLPPTLAWIRSEQDLERWLQPLWRKPWQARSDGPPPHVRIGCGMRACLVRGSATTT